MALLGPEPLVRPFYLAGGAALALHLGHRHSYDLDFFSPDSFDSHALAQRLAGLGSFLATTAKEDTLLGQFEGERISFFRYPYGLLGPLHEFRGLRVADPTDLLIMKLDAITRRGKRRDYIDIYFLVRAGLSLEEAIRRFPEKYGIARSPVVILKALTYFTDADQDQSPPMLQPARWEDVRTFLEQEARRIARAALDAGR